MIEKHRNTGLLHDISFKGHYDEDLFIHLQHFPNKVTKVIREVLYGSGVLYNTLQLSWQL